MVGFVLVDKPEGVTSHDVVARLRRVLSGTRVGHAGTLDPMATGLLVCGVGQATRLLGRLQHTRKTYEGRMRLGLVTDTQDVTGTILDKIDGVRIERRVIELAAQGFVGTIDQVPPAYSAIKSGGMPLHRRIRRGMAYEPPPARQVEIFRLDILKVDGTDVRFRVECGSGTYVRTLCHDWGAKLDVGGCLAGLRRTRSGVFDIEQSLPLDALDSEQAVRDALRSPGDAFPDLPRRACSPADVADVRNGRALEAGDAPQDAELALTLPTGAVFALGRVSQQNGARLIRAAPVLTDIIEACPEQNAK